MVSFTRCFPVFFLFFPISSERSTSCRTHGNRAANLFRSLAKRGKIAPDSSSKQIRLKLLCGTALLASLLAFDSQAEIKIELEPAEVWSWSSSGGYKSFEELQSAWNSWQETQFSACQRNPPYDCHKYVMEGRRPNPAFPLMVNGDYLYFDINATEHHKTVYYDGRTVTYTKDANNLFGVHRGLLCPSEEGYGGVIVSLGENLSRQTCVKRETPPIQCDSTGGKSGGNGAAGGVGNPIQIYSGLKTELEVDYATADGLLSIERPFLGQYAGWRMPGDVSFLDLFSMQTTVVGVRFTRSYWQDGASRAVTFSSPYIRTTSNGEVIVFNADGSRMQHPASSAGTFAVDVNGARIEHLSSPTPEGAIWRRTDANDVIEEFGADGRRRKKQLRNGLFVKYQYEDGRLARMADSRGRQITFAYDANGNLERATLPDGQSITYSYEMSYVPGPFNASGYALARVTYPDNTSRQYLYNESAYISGTPAQQSLTGIIDENGVRVGTYRYDYSKRASSTESAGGVNKYTLTYGKNYSQVTSPLGAVSTYYFKPAGDWMAVSSKSQPAGAGCGAATARYTYDTGGNVKTSIDFNGITTWYDHDLTRNLETTRIEAYGTVNARTITTTWHSAYRLPSQIIEPGRETTNDYDPASGNLLSRSIRDTATGRTRTWSYAYTDSGDNTLAKQLKSVDGPRTDVADLTRFEYYPNGDLHFIHNALNHTTEITQYDLNGRPKTVADPNGVMTSLDYWPRGWLKTYNRGGQSTHYEYDGAGQIKKVTFADGSFVAYDYDAAHRLTDLWDAQGSRIHYTLDNIGNRVREDMYDAQGNLVSTKSRAFDVLNRLWKDIGAFNQTTVNEYDANGNFKKSDGPRIDVTDVTQNSYDALNRITTVTDGLGGITRYGYDTQDLLAQVQAPNSATTQYQYDKLGNLLSEVSPDRGTTTYTHDEAGNVLTQTDARGVTTSYIYDALNRITRVSYPNTTENVIYTYDTCALGRGRLCRVQDAAGTSDYSYDAYGNVTSHIRTELNVAYITSYGYNAGNRLTSITYPNGRQVSYGRDTLGRINSINMQLQGTNTALVTNAGYRPDGLATSLVFGNSLTDIRRYDIQGQLREQYLGSADTRLYEYDASGNLSSLQSLPQVGLYRYDALNRLNNEDRTTQATVTTNWTYDANGNRKTQNTGAYAYLAASNRLTTAPGGGITLDAAGNTLSDGMRSYTYNNAGHLSTVAGAGYSYNAQRQRSRKIVGSQATVYHYDLAGNLLAETTADGNLIRDYVWVDSTPIAQVEAGEKLAYLHTDHLNTPRLGTDAQGQVVWRWEGTAFGETYPNEDVDGNGIKTTINLRFPGQYYDAETGLHYNWHRYYDPKLGRYVTSDPIGLNGGLNTYTYVGGNPINRIDANGLLCTFSQSSGTVSCTDGLSGSVYYYSPNNYSGLAFGKNNPDAQNIPFFGPLPRGCYRVGNPERKAKTGPNSIHLMPLFSHDDTNNFRELDTFFIHGDSIKRPGRASNGCPILPADRTNIPEGELFCVTR